MCTYDNVGYVITSSNLLSKIKDLNDFIFTDTKDINHASFYKSISYNELLFYVNPYLVYDDNRSILLKNKIDVCIHDVILDNIEYKKHISIKISIKYPESKLYILD